MTCEKCNHEIGPEEPRCRNCGAQNPYALQHMQNMEQYEAAYGDTRNEVISSAQKTRKLTKRAAILIVLIVACIIARVIIYFCYIDHDESKAVRRDAVKNAVSYASEAEDYLKRGEYMEFVSFLQAHELLYSQPKRFDHLRSVSYVAQEYYDCIRSMEEIILRSDDPDYFDGLDGNIRNFSRDIDAFYDVLDAQTSSEKNEEYLACMEDMQSDLEAAMKTYFSMDDAELKEFISATEAQKAVNLEKVLRHE
jgi:hypothetical protein